MSLAGTVKVTALVAEDGAVKSVEPVGGSPGLTTHFSLSLGCGRVYLPSTSLAIVASCMLEVPS